MEVEFWISQRLLGTAMEKQPSLLKLKCGLKGHPHHQIVPEDKFTREHKRNVWGNFQIAWEKLSMKAVVNETLLKASINTGNFSLTHEQKIPTELSICIGSTSPRLAPIFIRSLRISFKSSFWKFSGRHLLWVQEKEKVALTQLEDLHFYNDGKRMQKTF